MPKQPNTRLLIRAARIGCSSPTGISLRALCLTVMILMAYGGHRSVAGADSPEAAAGAAEQQPSASSSDDRATTQAPVRQSICPTFDTTDAKQHLAECERVHGPKAPETADALLYLAGQRFEDGATTDLDADFERAVEASEVAYGRESSQTSLCLMCYADFLRQAGRPREAVPLLQRALSIHEKRSGRDHPETVLAARSLAEALLWWEADLRSRNPLGRAPTAKEDLRYFRAHEHVGSRLFAEGLVDAARYHFERAVALRPDLGENHNNMGTVLSAQGHLDDAIECFKEARQLEPNVPAIGVNLANALASAERYAEAEASYRDLIANIERSHAAAVRESGNRNLPFDPAIAPLINNLGVVLYKQGKTEAAITAFRRALQINPTLQDAIESLALATGEAPTPTDHPPGDRNVKSPR